MKHFKQVVKVVFVVAALIGVGLGLHMERAHAMDVNGQWYPIGIWEEGGTRSSEYTDSVLPDPAAARLYYQEIFAEVKAMGADTVVQPNVSNNMMGIMLDEAQALGIKVIAQPNSLKGFLGNDAQAQTLVSAAITPYVNKPALLMWQFEDEPAQAQIDSNSDRNLHKHITLQDPKHPGFSAWYILGSMPQYNVNLATNNVTIDHYSIGVGSPEGSYGGVGDMISAFVANTPKDKQFWFAIQTHGWQGGGLREPTATELRFITYDALLRGAKGLFYFMQQSGSGIGVLRGAVDYDKNYRSYAMPAIQTLTAELKKIMPYLATSTLDSSSAATVTGMTPDQYDINSFTTENNEKLFMLANEKVVTQTFQISLDKTKLTQQLAKGTLQIQEVLSGAIIPYTNNATTLTFNYTLTKGDGKLFRLISQHSAIIAVTDAMDRVTLGQPVKLKVNLTNNGVSTWAAGSFQIGGTILNPDGTSTAAVITGGSIASSVAPGQSAALTLSIATGPGTSITQNGTSQVRLDMVTGGTWFNNVTSTPLMVEPTLLFADAFENISHHNIAGDPLPNWNKTAFMYVRNGKLTMSGGDITLSNYGSAWTDYTYEFDTSIDKEAANGSAFAGWVFRAQDKNNGYMTSLAASNATATPNSIRKHKLVGGVYTLVGTTSTGLTINRDQSYHIKMVLAGTSMKTYINGVLIDTWTDSTFTSGKIGLRAAEAGIEMSHYDNVMVYSLTADTIAPAQVTGASVAKQRMALSLNWSKVIDASTGGADVAYYKVYRSTTSGFAIGAGSLLNQTSKINYVDNAVTAGTTYYYKVAAVDIGGREGTASSQITAAADSGIPAVITGITFTASGMKALKVNWTASSAGDLQKYRVYRSAVSGFVPSTQNFIGESLTNTLMDSSPNLDANIGSVGLSPLSTYYYIVTAVDTSGNESAASTATSGTTAGSQVYSETFTSSAAGWTPLSGTWAVSGGKYVQSAFSINDTSYSFKKFGSFSVEADVNITAVNAGDTTNWVGITVRKTNAADAYNTSGYLIYLRKNGELNVWNKFDSNMASTSTGLDMSVTHRLKVVTKGQHIQVFVDNIMYIDIYDANNRFSAGYFGFTTYYATAQYDNVNAYLWDGFSYHLRLGANAPYAGTTAGWTTSTGSVSLGQLTLTNPSNNQMTWNDTVIGNSTTELQLKTVARSADTAWGGITIRKTNAADSYTASGYMIYYRHNGEINIYNHFDGNVATVSTGILLDQYRVLKVTAVGSVITVFVDGVQKLTWTDPNNRFTQGYTSINSDTTQLQVNVAMVY